MSTQILMPALSPTMTEGKLAKWLKKEGDAIKSGDVIAEIETDKATMEMEAVDEGTLERILVPAGTEKVLVNQPIAVLLLEGESKDAAKAPPAAPKAAPPPEMKAEPVKAPPPAPAKPVAALPPQAAAPAPKPAGNRVFASPLARRIAANAGIDLATMKGGGPQGRIVRADVDKAVSTGSAPKAAASAAAKPAAATDTNQPYTEVRNSLMRKTIAKRLTEAKSTVPHFYMTIDCLIDDL